MLGALLLTAVTAAGQPHEVVELFFRRLNAGDARAAALWEQPEELERTFARTRGTRCMQLERLELSPAGERTVIARTTVTRWSAMPGARAHTDATAHRVTLQPHGESWKIAGLTSLEDEHARALTEAPERERLRLLDACGDDCRTYRFVLALNGRVSALFNQQQYSRAGELLDLGETIARELEDDRAISAILGARSALARVTHQGAASVRFGEGSLAHAERSGDPDSLARALLRLGRAHVSNTSRGNAKPLFDRGFALADYVEDASVAALLATQLAWHADAMADGREALYYSVAAMELSEQTTDPAARVSAEMNLGGSYLVHGQFELARDHYQTALELSRQANYTATMSSVLMRLIHIDLALHDTATAERSLAEAATLVTGDSNMGLWFDVLIARADVKRMTGDFAAAEAAAAEALRRVEESGNHRHVIAALVSLSDTFVARKQPEEALAALRLAEHRTTLLPPIDRPELQAPMANVLRQLGRIDEALQYIEEHVASLDVQRARLAGTDAQKRVWYDARAGAYLSYIDLLLRKGEPLRAWRALQRMRSQLVQEERPVVAKDDELRQREQRIVTLNKALAAAKGTARRRQLRRELARARLELEDFATRGTKEWRPVPAPLDEAADPDTPKDLVVAEYVLLDAELVIFAVHGGKVHHVRTPVGRTSIEKRVAAFTAKIAARDRDYGAEARALYDLLLAPIERHVRGRTLAIVPHDVLWTLPFHALRTRGGRHLVEEQTIFYAPSVALAAARRRSTAAEAEVLAFANPHIAAETGRRFRAVYRNTLGPLPHAEEEVRALARIYGRERVRIYTGAAAREAVFKREAGRFRILHVATHGVLDAAAPLYSAVLLTPDATEDGLLEAREITTMRLNADLAVLAACDTARGEISPGEGLIGMSWALQLAGCPTVAVSHWRAESAATSRLMIRFHEALAAGRSPAAAMRAGQRLLMSDPRYAHPFYWAAFVVVGAGHHEGR